MVRVEKWGEIEKGTASLYTLENQQGMKVVLTDLGAAVMAMVYQGIDVALGFDKLEEYRKQTGFIGATAGRCANRIRCGQFALDGTEYQVGTNDGKNHLHGGFQGFDKVLWTAEEISQTGNSVSFSHFSEDGDQGYPGNLRTRVTYTLDEDCALKIDYEAFTDQTTIVNLTNHTYFNLSGHHSGSITDQWLKINADSMTESDVECVPTGKILPVDGTPFDFREYHQIGERIGADHEQLKCGGGYDHNYVLGQTKGVIRTADAAKENGADNGTDAVLKLAAEAYSDATNIHMQVYTDMPGIQLYSGNFMDGTAVGKEGAVYSYRTGFCLETQYYPDAVHHTEFPQPILKPGQVFRSATIYHFGDHRA